MKLIEDIPQLKLLRRYIEKYQFFDIDKPIYVKTVPNAKIECWIVLEGGFEIFSFEENRFIKSKRAGFFPMGTSTSVYRVPKSVKCLNIKMNPSILGLSFFKGFTKNWQKISLSDYFSEKKLKIIRELDYDEVKGFDVSKIDSVMKGFFESLEVEERIIKFIELIYGNPNSGYKISDFAKELNISTKTLVRLTKKHTGLLPKEFLRILRFERTTHEFKKNEAMSFIDALEYGYYDQSHFIKECRRITGYSPKDFFSKLKLSTNDLMFMKD